MRQRHQSQRGVLKGHDGREAAFSHLRVNERLFLYVCPRVICSVPVFSADRRPLPVPERASGRDLDRRSPQSNRSSFRIPYAPRTTNLSHFRARAIVAHRLLVQDAHFTYAASPSVGWWAPNDIQAHIEPTKTAGLLHIFYLTFTYSLFSKYVHARQFGAALTGRATQRHILTVIMLSILYGTHAHTHKRTITAAPDVPATMPSYWNSESNAYCSVCIPMYRSPRLSLQIYHSLFVFVSCTKLLAQVRF